MKSGINKLFGRWWSAPLSFACNILLAYVVLMLTRIIFLAVNFSYFDGISWSQVPKMINGALWFDTSAIMYLNILYALMMLLPLHFKEKRIYNKVAKGVFVTVNSIAVVMNLVDTVYFQYTNRRTTSSVFNEFSNESNIGSIFGVEIVNHWYLTLAGIALIWLMFKAYRTPEIKDTKPLWRYYSIQTLSLIVFIPLCIGGMRGGLGHAVRPITISNANQYVDRPIETAIVLNTPFAMMRTMGKKPFKNPGYYESIEMAEAYLSPVHKPGDGEFKQLNVVVFILESFGKEYIGALNTHLENGNYKGFTPFLDSIIGQSLTFEYSFSNGRKSIDGMPSVLSGIPSFNEPFFLTPGSLNEISGVAGELKKKGYYTSFFHGAPNGSMGFEAFSRTSGFTDYFGKNEYNNDADFDGKWAIWDEEFFKYFANEQTRFSQPFASAIFSASSHHPFAIPKRYKDIYPEEDLPIHKCIRYSDNALREYFNIVSKTDWFENTLFVITADHTNQTNQKIYQTESGLFAVPVIFYHPGSDLRGVSKSIAQQTDIYPTIMGYLNYDKPYLAYGNDLLNTPEENSYAVNYVNGIYQYHKGDYLLQFDGVKPVGLYRFRTDVMLQDNLINKEEVPEDMLNEIRAIIQSYMTRMISDMLVVK